MYLGGGNPRKAVKRGRPLIQQNQLPASTRGLNLHDGIASMKPADALILDNWFPEATYLRVRGGKYMHAAQGPGAIYSLMEWAGPSSRKFFAATETTITDITTTGPFGVPDVTGLASGYWSTTMMATPGGHFLVAANGLDDVRNYNGTAWTTPAITGVTSSTLNFVWLHKARLWFVENNSTKAWYLPTNSIAGAASGFELGGQFTDGGRLVAIGSVSRDGGSGSDDYLAFISSDGQVAVYQGDDPASASTWALVGVYNCAPPIGNRCVTNIEGDLAILTEAAIISTRQLMSSGGSTAERQAISNRIDQGIIQAFASYGAIPGWSVNSYPRTRQAVFNVPTSPTTAFQFVVNTQTGAWCTYGLLDSPFNATCWGLFNEQPFFGMSDGTVWQAERGFSDQAQGDIEFFGSGLIEFESDSGDLITFYGGNVSTFITAQVKTSFQNYGKPGGVARMTMIQPLFTAGGQVVPAIRINVDYQNDKPLSTDEYPLAAGGAGSNWDEALWDSGTWGSEAAPFNNWTAATGIGTVASVNMVTQTRINTILNAWNLKSEVAQQVTL